MPWVKELSDIIHWNVSKPYEKQPDWSATLDRSARFTPARHARFSYVQMAHADTLVERVVSTSYLAALTTTSACRTRARPCAGGRPGRPRPVRAERLHRERGLLQQPEPPW